MHKSTLAIAVAVGLLAQQASAAGFIEDSKATLKLRNFYINNDNRDSGTKAAGAQSKTEEWGQGFQLDFTSGFTQGTVGFGIDAIGLLGVKLDSSAGKHGNPNGANYGGSVFPSDGNHAVDDFSSLGLTAKAKVSQTELRIGTLQPKLPVIVSNDGRMLPQTFQGGQITSSEFKDLTARSSTPRAVTPATTKACRLPARTIPLRASSLTSSTTAVWTTRSTKTCCCSTTTATWKISTNKTSWAWFTTGPSVRAC